MNCGYCGEELDPREECICPGSNICTCEFEHHHAGCCEDYAEIVQHFEEDHPEVSKDDLWAICDFVPLAVLDAHDEYQPADRRMRGEAVSNG